MHSERRPAVDGDTHVRLTLPSAAPDDYLAWTAWWREVETLMLERPGLEARASADAAPFLRGPVARLMSDLSAEVTKQALDALMMGLDSTEVVLEFQASSDDLLAIASYMERRGAWVAQYARVIGIEPPTERVERIRMRTIAIFRQAADRVSYSSQEHATE